jgi:AcrR family transcriptional regulator
VKESIVRESIKLFEKKGFSETSIQDVVDALGVTKGTFYYYFNSKEELLMDIHLIYINKILQEQQLILANQDNNCKEKLLDIAKLLIGSIENQGASARVFFREMRNLNDEHLTEIIKKRDQFRINVQELVETGIRQREFRNDLQPDIVTFGVLGICNWSYFWFNPNGKVKDQEVAGIFVEMLLNGIQPIEAQC